MILWGTIFFKVKCSYVYFVSEYTEMYCCLAVQPVAVSRGVESKIVSYKSLPGFSGVSAVQQNRKDE